MKLFGLELKFNGVDVETTTGAQTKANAARDNARSFALTLNTLYNADTRAVDSPPSFYNATRGMHNEFKQTSVVGLTAFGSGTYCTILTDARWSGTSGGRKNQIAITDNGKLFTRLGSSDETSWGSWVEIETAAGSQTKADKAETNAKAAIPTKMSQLENDIGAGGGIKITTSALAPADTSPGDFWYKEG